MDAIFLQLDQQELADELARTEAILGQVDEDEREAYEILRRLEARVASYGELRNATVEEQTAHLKQRLAEIHAEREVQLRDVKSVRTSLSGTFSTPTEEDPGDNPYAQLVVDPLLD